MGCGAEICRSENRTCKREPYNQESADGNYHRQKGNRNGQAARRRQICHLEQRQRRSDRSGNAA